MSKLEIHFDIPDRDTFNKARRAIICHLTPTNEEKASLFTRYALPQVREELGKSLGPLEFEIRASMDWSNAHRIANDLGLSGTVEEVTSDRYQIPNVPGSTTSHDISLFGKKATGVGDYPLTLRISSDDAGIGDHLYLLRSWRDEFRERGARLIDGDIADVRNRTQGVSPEHDQILAGLPRSEGDFNEKIAEQARQLNQLLATEAVNLVRFAEDFIVRPLRGQGITPVAAQMQGPYDFEVLIDPGVIPTIAQFPTLDSKEAISLLIPEPSEDITLVEED